MGQYLFSCHGNAVKEYLRLFICCFVETCSETEDRSFTHDLLCTCTLLQRSKTDVRVLTLHGFSNSTKIKKIISNLCAALLHFSNKTYFKHYYFIFSRYFRS
jgi:hypothetical protein